MKSLSPLLECLEAEKKCLYELLYQYSKKIFLSIEKFHKHRNATDCYVCHGKFTKEIYEVRDHNHLTGDYRGLAHLKWDSSDVYEIDKILGKSKGKLLVKWKGYDDPSWIPDAEPTSS
jgi:hypothetical protein